MAYLGRSLSKASAQDDKTVVARAVPIATPTRDRALVVSRAIAVQASAALRVAGALTGELVRSASESLRAGRVHEHRPEEVSAPAPTPTQAVEKSESVFFPDTVPSWMEQETPTQAEESVSTEG